MRAFTKTDTVPLNVYAAGVRSRIFIVKCAKKFKSRPLASYAPDLVNWED